MTEITTKMYWLQAITPLHVGAGKGVGFIDLPIMREKVTNWPVVPGSAIKGVMRDHFTEKDKKDQGLINSAFGTQGQENESNAGSLVLTDAHIVCMPVRSLYGTFAYVTSPFGLERLKRDLKAAGYNELHNTPQPGKIEAYHSKESAIIPGNGGKILFEDLDFTATEDPDTGKWAQFLSDLLFPDPEWRDIFRKRFAIVADDRFTFLSEIGTDVAARVKIDGDKKIVAKGALWYEESLPSESILAGIAWCDRVNGNKDTTRTKILDTFCKLDLNLQIGGKANVGKGRIRCRFTHG